MSREGLAEFFPATLTKEFYILKSSMVLAQIGGHAYIYFIKG